MVTTPHHQSECSLHWHWLHRCSLCWWILRWIALGFSQCCTTIALFSELLSNRCVECSWDCHTHNTVYTGRGVKLLMCIYVGVHLIAIAATPSPPFVASRCLLGWSSEPDYPSPCCWSILDWPHTGYSVQKSPSCLSLHIVLTTSPLAYGLYIVVTHYVVSHQMYKNCTEGQRPSLPSLGLLHHLHASMCDSLWRGFCNVYGSASLGWQLSTASGDAYGLVFSECRMHMDVICTSTNRNPHS